LFEMGPHAHYLNDPSKSLSLEHLNKLGLFYWKLDADNYEKDGTLDKICTDRGYTYRDEVSSTKIPNLDEKLKNFFEEHLHDDEEIRFFLDGSGFFDVRDEKFSNNEWIRLHLFKGELITLPAGIYHRFTADENRFFHVLRLFVGEPVWTPYNRCESATDSRDSRKRYVESYLQEKQ